MAVEAVGGRPARVAALDKRVKRRLQETMETWYLVDTVPKGGSSLTGRQRTQKNLVRVLGPFDKRILLSNDRS